jgi:phosphatidylserine decarboxylase
MIEITFLDRLTGKVEKEKVYGQFFLEMMYGDGWVSRFFSFFLLPIIARVPLLSKLYGLFQKSTMSRFKVKPFVRAYHIDASEFAESIDSFHSFNAFFIRHLKPECRPVAPGNDVVILPADARYLVYPNIAEADGFWVKGKKFSLGELLQDAKLAEKYAQGAMVIARLCPVDYHRFHFPCDCIASAPRLINGPLFSVNPIALKRNIGILSENRRVITALKTQDFGTVQYIEVGATHVGSIHQTFTPGRSYVKGEEKGYFSFGGSCLVLLFEPDTIRFDQDLVNASLKKMEVRALLGQSLGKRH